MSTSEGTRDERYPPAPAPASALEPCLGLFGDYRIDQGPPSVIEVVRGVYMPMLLTIDEPCWGIYDSDGRIVEEAAYKRGPGRGLVGQLDHVEVPSRLDTIHEEMIYGGAMQAHYGHFVLDMLPRFWIDFTAHPDRKILVHSNVDLDVVFSIDFVRDIFGALGLERSRFVALDRPSVVDRLIIPELLFNELSSANQLFARLCETINARFNLPVPRTKGVLYLSKEKLARGVWSVANESRISARLAVGGVDVVHPERLPLREQMVLFEQYETICGLAGSALHTSLFSRASNRIVGLNHNTFVMSNYRMIDRMKSNDAMYVHPSGSMMVLGPKDGFSSVYECPNPERVADELLELF